METLSVVVPVYNEEKKLEQFVRHMMNTECPVPRDWIFIDDCSQDQSPKILESLSEEYGFRYHRRRRNRGKSAAIARGIKEVKGSICMIQDVNFDYDANDVGTLLKPILEQKADVVYGNRFSRNTSHVHRTYHYLLNRILTFFSNAFSGLLLSDMRTSYKAFRTDLLQSVKIKSKRYGIEEELTAYLGKIRARIHEVPISYDPQNHLKRHQVRWVSGFVSIWKLFRFNFFVSSKEAFENLPKKYDTFRILKKPTEKYEPNWKPNEPEMDEESKEDPNSLNH